jgi:hypothetical protein
MQSFTYNDVHESTEWTIIEETCGSDYSGSVVARANYEWFRDTMTANDDLALLYGHFFTYGVAYRKDTKDTQILELIDSLEEYPSICDMTLARVENVLIQEAMEWVIRDFRCEIGAMGIENEDISDDTIARVFDACLAFSGETWFHEYDEMSINIKRVACAFPAVIEEFPIFANQSIKF